MEAEKQPPLCVDLDGTLIQTDLLCESALACLKKNPFSIFLFPFWLLKGKVFFKERLASDFQLDASVLPYNKTFLSYLKTQKKEKRRLILATGSHRRLAGLVAAHLGFFDEVLATEGSSNLSGRNKRDLLIQRFGGKGFDYAGNSFIDLKIWPSAREAVVVEANSCVQKKAAKISHVTRVFKEERGFLFFQVLRLHQWTKNILLFVPIFAAHKPLDLILGVQLVLAFICFGLVSSSLYILNDLFDLNADRHHKTKRDRPIPSGRFSIFHALFLVPFLLVAAFTISMGRLPAAYSQILAVYAISSLLYSLRLKSIVLVDVLFLAALYTLRIIGGGAATNVPISFWLLSTSMFFFLSLAFIKRYSELSMLSQTGEVTTKGRDYRTTDLPMLGSIGVASGLMSVVLLALYINNPESLRLYSHPERIWLLCPLVLYWIGNVWLLAHRGGILMDPVSHAIKSKNTWVIAVLGGIVLWLAQ